MFAPKSELFAESVDWVIVMEPVFCTPPPPPSPLGPVPMTPLLKRVLLLTVVVPKFAIAPPSVIAVLPLNVFPMRVAWAPPACWQDTGCGQAGWHKTTPG